MYEFILPLDEALLQGFAALRNPVFDALFWTATSLGNEPFLLMFGALGYWFFDKSVFSRAILMLLIAALINSVIKEYAALPRPTITALYTAEGYSFPSGHSQTAAAFWGWLAWEIRHRVKAAWALIGLSVLVALSRPYLGVHHFHDIFVGLLLGYAQVLLAARLMGRDQADAPVGLKDWMIAAVGCVGLTVFAFTWFDNPDMQKLMIVLTAFLSAFLFGRPMERRWVNYQMPATWPTRMGAAVVGFAGLMLFWRGLKPVFGMAGFEGMLADYLRYAATGLWIAAGLPALATWWQRRSS